MNKKNNPALKSIINGLNQGLEYANGKMPSIKRRKVSIAPIPDFDGEKVRSLRNKLNLSQTLFAAALGVSLKTVEAWENGRNKPTGPARRMLQLLDIENHFLENHNIISV